MSEVGGAPVGGTISLALRMYFASTDHWIDVGAIGLVVRPIVSDVDDGAVIEDLGLSLRPNTPNPFGPETMIEYRLDSADQVELQILDVSVRAVRTLFRGEQSMGEYRVMWDGRNNRGAQMPAGTYYYLVRIGEQEGSHGMVMVNQPADKPGRAARTCRPARSHASDGDYRTQTIGWNPLPWSDSNR